MNSPASPAVPASPVQCPRCAYDLSGQVATFTDSSPVEGTCSECGLRFEWRELLDPDLAGPIWSFEHGHRRLVARYVRTLARVVALAPAWRGLTLTTSVHRVRLIVFAVITLLMMQAVAGLTIIVSRALNATMAGIIRREWHRYLLWPYGEGRMFSPLDGMPFGTPLLLITLAITLAMPLGLLLLGETFGRHSIRAVHLLRGGCYSTAIAAAWIIGTTVLKNMLRHTSGYTFLEAMTRHGITMPALGAVYALVLGAWWWAFIRRYLRISEATLITLVMMGTAYLAAMTFLIGLGVLIKVV